MFIGISTLFCSHELWCRYLWGVNCRSCARIHVLRIDGMEHCMEKYSVAYIRRLKKWQNDTEEQKNLGIIQARTQHLVLHWAVSSAV